MATTIYLDNNATTRTHPEVIELMTRLWRDGYANPGSPHAEGRRARLALERARESLAAILGADPDEVIFTSGGTESNNMALFGLATGEPGTIALTAGEHPSVMEPCRALASRGWKLQFLPVDEDGLLPAPEGACMFPPLARGGRGGGAAVAAEVSEHVEGPTSNVERRVDQPVATQPVIRNPQSAITASAGSTSLPPLAKGGMPADVKLATIILAHNETGVIQELEPWAMECRTRGIPLHVDAVQAVGKIPVDFHRLGVSSLALGAHKFHGPRGVGALLLRRGTKLAPSAFGGHQEAGRRPGTEVVPLIAGMTRALELFHAEQDERQARLRQLRDDLHQQLSALCPPLILNGSRDRRLPNTLNVAFPGVDGEALLVSLDLEGVACSLGSTCASGSAEPSPVLVAMNRPADVSRSSVRFSLGIENTADEISRAAQLIARTVNRLRSN